MNWTMPTATSSYVVDLADGQAGPVLQDWTSGPVRDWTPDQLQSFTTPADQLPSEFSALGTRQVRAAELIVERGPLVGARLIWPEDQVSFTDDGTVCTFTATATDTVGSLTITVHITTSRKHDVVTKWATISNVGDQPAELRRAFGPAWQLPLAGPVEVDYLGGHWSREFTPFNVSLSAGELTIGSRQGITSQEYSPVFAVSQADQAYGLALAWCGSWRMGVEVVPFRPRTRVAGGVDDESTTILLEPGESFTTPATLGIHSAEGTDGLRGRWHDYARGQLLREIEPAPVGQAQRRPVVYNSWYATTFDVHLEHQLQLADRAAQIGVETFVIDDGWFEGRVNDHHGLGQWWPDPVKFPDGLDPLITGVLQRGMNFGLWVEPEAVNPGAKVLVEHPDWVHHAGDRPLVTARNQYVLNFGNPEVIAWTKGWLRDLLADERITFVKWDMNRPVSDGGDIDDPHGRQWAVEHARGYLDVMTMLREEFPHVTVEACSGGGGRIDFSVLGVSDVVWTSDETGPRDRLAIQYGFLSTYPATTMSSWVTDEPDRVDLTGASEEFRFVMAMAGVFGIGSDLSAWTDEQVASASELVALYKTIRPTVFTGRVEFHGKPSDDVFVIEYGTDDQTILLAFARPGRPERPVIIPKTLDAVRGYRVRGSDTVLDAGEQRELAIGFGFGGDADVIILDAQ